MHLSLILYEQMYSDTKNHYFYLEIQILFTLHSYHRGGALFTRAKRGHVYLSQSGCSIALSTLICSEMGKWPKPLPIKVNLYIEFSEQDVLYKDSYLFLVGFDEVCQFHKLWPLFCRHEEESFGINNIKYG